MTDERSSKPIPVGRYLARIEDVRYVRTSKKVEPNIQLTFTILKGLEESNKELTTSHKRCKVTYSL